MRPSPERRPSPSRRSRVSPQGPHYQRHSPQNNDHAHPNHHRRSIPGGEGDEPTPICRCRVLYLGSAVPHVTKDGLQGIQEPLKELYPEDGALGAKGIDSWLSVWSNGFLLENMDENRKKVTRFFPVESLHYCAAVRYVLVPGSTSNDKVARFLPLDSPFARNPNINHPPLFAAILRRTSGIKVLECHVFICKRETAANALVRCSFHAYADSTYAKHIEGGQSLYGTLGGLTPVPSATPLLVPPPQMSSSMRPETPREYQQSVIEMSEDSINSIEKVEEWKVLANGTTSSPTPAAAGYRNNVSTNNASPRENGNGTGPEEISVFNGDENHKVWAGKQIQPDSPDGIYDYGSTMRSFRSSASGLSHRNRPRQMVMPSSPPPPPIPEEGSPSKEERKEKKKKKRSKSRDDVDGSTDMLMAPPLVNGSAMNGGTRSASALGGRQTNGDAYMAGPYPPRMNGHNGHGPPRGLPPPHPQPIMMIPMSGKKAGTFSARQKGMQRPIPPFMMYGGPPPPFGVQYGPPPGYYGPPPPQGPMMGRPGSRAMEEPIYMPHNARPLSPVASYQPGHFPHEAYYNQQQYATIDKANRYRKGKPSKNGSKSSKDSKGKHQSSDSNAEDSEFSNYKNKGPINDRGFPYSMRTDQRSRSYGSLANMQFGPNGEAMPPHPPGAEMGQNGHAPEAKKEREFMQMMGDLDLADDLIERSEVPPGLYPPGQPPNMMYGAPLPPPPHAHMVMMPTDPIAAGHHRRRRR